MNVTDKIHHVLTVHGAGLSRHASRHVTEANDCHTVFRRVNLSFFGELAIATPKCSKVHDDTSWLHRSNSILCDQERGLPSRNCSCAKCNVHRLELLQKGCFLRICKFLRTLFGIATLPC